MKKLCRFLVSFTLLFSMAYPAHAETGKTEYVYESGDIQYRYFVVQSGDNYNFEFENGPESTIERLKAGVHVLQSLYEDSSIELEKRESYIRERAACSLFEGDFYNYTFCILPNEFSTNKQDVFRGFVTQLPSWKWMVVWILLPVLLIFGLIFFRKPKP